MLNEIIAPQTMLLLQRNNIQTRYTDYFKKPFPPKTPQVLFITSYPPRECGIATYSRDLIIALRKKYQKTINMSLCALETDTEKHYYAGANKFMLNTDDEASFEKLAAQINRDSDIELVVIQHEFGFFYKNEEAFLAMLKAITKPTSVVFHTVLPDPSSSLLRMVREIASLSENIIVMTNSSAGILTSEYQIPSAKITVIPHGTHLVKQVDKDILKLKYGLEGKKILSTFGLLSSGKSIETTISALKSVVALYPDVLFLIIGKTHPTVLKNDGEVYRQSLQEQVAANGLEQHVRFINSFLPLEILLEYLQLTDIYLFTSKDPNQAVSGTFSYAISCGCPIISTPIPHALEVLRGQEGIIVDFGAADQLSTAICRLLADGQLRSDISLNGLHRMASTAWENSAIAHGKLFEQVSSGKVAPKYSLPPISLDQIIKMTTDFGIIQFSKLNQPDLSTGYTLDDNARALVALCQHFEVTQDSRDLELIRIYFDFIKFCLQPDGQFLNYVDADRQFTAQNFDTDLLDANGRAIWALGYLSSLSHALPYDLVAECEIVMLSALSNATDIHATRAMAFVIKGLYYKSKSYISPKELLLTAELADRLLQMYRHEKDGKWHWFESYLTYANSVVPEALLCAWMLTGNQTYKDVAKESFDFLLSQIISDQGINVISNKKWLQKGTPGLVGQKGGEQPIDVAYTVIALQKFIQVFPAAGYQGVMSIAFDWFLGRNHLNQIIYNPCTGGCYDGIEEYSVNLNQGAESTVSYLMARLIMEKVGSAKMLLEDEKLRHLKTTTLKQLA